MNSSRRSVLLPILLVMLSLPNLPAFEFQEATIDAIQKAFADGALTSRQLVEHYLRRIELLNPVLHAVIEVNPDALDQADRADRERRSGRGGDLHGVPVLLKDIISTKDRLNTTAGSFALLGSVVPRDAGVVTRLRRAGAVILGKSSLSEWCRVRTFDEPNGWSARGGQGRNPYVLWADPCGSSSGSAIAAAADLAAVTLGSETDGSIICPSAYNSVVGIKPTVGLTSRAGVIPISFRQDTIGPICRTVSDAVQLLEAIVGYDLLDSVATSAALKYIPPGGYKQFLKVDGLKDKRIGIIGSLFDFPKGSLEKTTFEEHFDTMRKKGATLIDNLAIANESIILDATKSGELAVMLADFKMEINSYLSDLSNSPVRTLAEMITFNNEHKALEKTVEYGQVNFLVAEKTSGIGDAEKIAIEEMAKLSTEGLERLMVEERLDAIVMPDARGSSILAIGGYPGISIPAGYKESGMPFGACFGGLKGSEPKLIEIAYSFEQATMVRKPPALSYVYDKVNNDGAFSA